MKISTQVTVPIFQVTSVFIMSDIEDFVSKFHNLEGLTLGEKQRSFRKMLNQNTVLLQDVNAVDKIVKKITPKTHLEDMFKLQILLYCRRILELFDIFTSGNELLINKIIKHNWFIKSICQERDAQQITNDLLPCLSYSIRMKFLKRISLHLNNGDKVYHIFETVKQRYGLQVAMPLILGCSVPHIEFIIKNNAITFRERALKHFIKIAPKLLPLYVEEYDRQYHNLSFIHRNDFLRYIASIDYDVYHCLKEKYKVGVYHGKRASRKLFEERKEEILDNLSYYEDYLNKSIFVRKLGKYGHFKKYLLSTFSRKLEDFSRDSYSRVYSLLEFYPRNKRFQLLEQSFEEAYEIPLVDCPKQITKPILDMVSDVNKREKMVENIMQSEYLDNVDYMIYLPTSRSIPFIKKELDLSANDIVRRNQLIEALVSTCKINNNLDSLKEVSKFILIRHRNDLKILRNYFTLLAQNFDLHKFTKDLWNVISEIINIYKMKRGYMGDTSISDILLTHLEFLYDNGEPLDELLLHYMKNNTYIVIDVFLHHCKNLNYIQALVCLMIHFLPKVYEGDDDRQCYLCVSVLKWNKKHQDHKIPIEDQLLDAVNREMKRDLFVYDLKLLICREDRNDKIRQISSLYWEKHLKDEDIVLYYLKWYPFIPKEYTESLVEALSVFKADQVNKIFTWIKKYDHIQLPDNILKCAKNLLNDEKRDTQHMVKYMARLMNPEDYISFVDEYKPKKSPVDVIDKQEKSIYKLQCQILESFSYVCSPLVLPHILGYCSRNFLEFVLAPLYKCFCRVPEEKLIPFVNQLAKNPLSLRKHALFLAAQVCTQEILKNILKSSLAMEKNLSLQKRSVLIAFHLFRRNASNDLWELFKCALTLIDKNDESTFELLIGDSYISVKYQLRYYEEVWGLLAKSGLLESKRLHLRNKLVTKMKPCVKDLSLKLCIDVIETLFLRYSDSLNYEGYASHNFIYEFLLHHEDPERFERIYHVITNAKILSLHEPKSKSNIYNEIMSFIATFYHSFLSTGFTKEWDRELLKDFIKKLGELYPNTDFFNKYVCLLLLLVLIDLDEVNITDYAIKVSELCQYIVNKYGPYVINFLDINIVKTMEYFEKTLQTDTVKIGFVEELLKISKSELDYVIAFKVFEYCYNKNENIINIFKASEYCYIQSMLRERYI